MRGVERHFLQLFWRWNFFLLETLHLLVAAVNLYLIYTLWYYELIQIIITDSSFVFVIGTSAYLNKQRGDIIWILKGKTSEKKEKRRRG